MLKLYSMGEEGPGDQQIGDWNKLLNGSGIGVRVPGAAADRAHSSEENCEEGEYDGSSDPRLAVSKSSSLPCRGLREN